MGSSLQWFGPMWKGNTELWVDNCFLHPIIFFLHLITSWIYYLELSKRFRFSFPGNQFLFLWKTFSWNFLMRWKEKLDGGQEAIGFWAWWYFLGPLLFSTITLMYYYLIGLGLWSIFLLWSGRIESIREVITRNIGY